MRALGASLALFALAGCAVVPPPVPAFPGGPEMVVVVQPPTIPTYSNVSPPRGTVGVTLWGPVEKLPSPPTDATSGDSELAITIDSQSIPGNVAARNGLGTVVLGYSFKTPIRAALYHYRYDLRVPRADHSPAGVAQVVAYLNLHDRSSGAHLWLGQIAFDTRCGGGRGGAMWDQGTATAIYNAPAANFSCTTFTDWRTLSFVAGPEQIISAATAVRARYPAIKLSGDPDDYEVTHLNLNPETATRPGETARIDVGVRNWRLATQP